MTDANQEYSLGGFGARLKSAREALNLSQKDAALRLHLNPNILDILETENFQKAPPATFMRGYLRSYARLLNFSEEDINAALTQSGLETQTRSLVIPNLREEITPMSDHHVQRISTYVVLGLFVFIGIWWGFHSSSNNNMIAKSNQLSAPPVPKPASVTQTLPPTQPVVTATTPAAAPATVASPPQTVAPVTQQQTVATTNAPVATTPATISPGPAAPTQTAPTTVATPAQAAPAMANTAGTTPTTTEPATQPITANVAPAVAPTATPQIIIPFRAPNTTVASSDNSNTPKKHNRHHQQTGTVSGFSMALPEPGL